MAPGYDLVLSSSRVVLPDGIRPPAVALRAGRIAAIHEQGAPDPSVQDEPAGAVDLGDLALLPGLVDTHVHVNEPGRTEWEGFGTATRAAAAGGVTTIVDMPLNSSPVTTSSAAYRVKVEAAAGSCFVDYGLWGGVIPGNAHELGALVDAGALGFKCFLCPSGIDDFPAVDARDLREAMRILADLDAVLLAHAEDPATLRTAMQSAGLDRGPGTSYPAYLASRPPEAERRAIDRLVAACRASGCRTHVVHLSSADGLDAVEAARAEGLPLTAETCPHYLTLCAEDIPDGAPLYKCAPPIREARERDSLWRGLANGSIGMVVSDHSPCPPSMKSLGTGDLAGAWGGIASLQLGLPLTWTSARRRGHDLDRIAEWMAAAPARLAGLGGRKGRIAPGYDADLVAFDADDEIVVEGSNLYHRHPRTPYEGWRLTGRVVKTWVRGTAVFDESGLRGDPIGQLLDRGT